MLETKNEEIKMLFYYIRHGDPIYDPDSLTPLGERQAESVAKRLALHGIDEIYASTSNRAILTARPTAEILKKEITELDFANESHAWRSFTIDAKNPDRKTFLFHSREAKEAFRTPECRALGDRWYDHPEFSLDRDRYEQGVARVRRESDEFFESLGYKHLGNGKYEVVNHTSKRVALFAHQGFGMIFLPTIIGIPYSEFATRFDMTHTGVTVINFEDEGGFAYPKILTLSNDSHIFRDGLPTKYINGVYI